MKFNDLMNNLIGTGSFLGMIAFCVVTVSCRDEIPVADVTNYQRTADSGTMETAHYDGHTFVLWESNSSGKGGIVHHPSCDCLKTEVKP